jgi:hypothetical protein
MQAFRPSDQKYIFEPDAEAVEILHVHHNGIVDRRMGDLKDRTSFARPMD